MERRAHQDYSLAVLISFAFHKPSDMPKPGKPQDAAPVSDAQKQVANMELRAWFMARAKKSEKAKGAR